MLSEVFGQNELVKSMGQTFWHFGSRALGDNASA